MRLNLDCVRDVLLAVEGFGMREKITIDALEAKLTDHAREDIEYTCLKLEEGGFLTLQKATYIRSGAPQIHRIKELTYPGHEFLDSIRSENNWTKVKAVAKKSGVTTIKAIWDIAQEVVRAAILSALQLGQ